MSARVVSLLDPEFGVGLRMRGMVLAPCILLGAKVGKSRWEVEPRSVAQQRASEIAGLSDASGRLALS